MAFTSGSKLGTYEVLSPIGAGGMGEVWRAFDTKLEREVAIKTLPVEFAQDADRVSRLEREARLLASLNHPNIAAIHGLEECDHATFLVLELIDGETLADRLKRGAIPIDEALTIGLQIAGALEAAHERGIIHRDLKPANIKVTPNGTVKVLDFGLAKALESTPAAGTVSSDSPTLSMAATNAGLILGTAAYMSPEQAKGKTVDRRADIWAFGVVLYEMLTGLRLFAGEEVGDVLASVIKDEPEWDRVPRKVQKLLKSCLEKDPKKRLRDIGDAWRLLEEPSRAQDARGGRLPWVVAAAFGVIAIGLGSMVWRATRPADPQTVRFEIGLPEGSVTGSFELSPDGRYVLLGGTQIAGATFGQLWIRPIDSLEVRALPGTEGAFLPFWSPDSAYIGFVSAGKLKKVAVTGGPAQTLCDTQGFTGGTWNRDGVIVFSSGGAFYRVAEGGGTPLPLMKPASGEVNRFPEFLPDGRHFLYTVNGLKPETNGIYLGSLDGAPGVRVLPDVSNALYMPPNTRSQSGHLLFTREATLVAQPFDPNQLRLIGDAFPIAEQVGFSSMNGHAAVSVSSNGTLAYSRGLAGGQRQLVWMDRSGKRFDVIAKPGAITFESLSPDEKRVAFSLLDGTINRDIWLYEFARGTTTRFTFGPGQDSQAAWSPEGASIIYESGATSGGIGDIYRKPTSGAGKEELLLRVGHDLRIQDWSRDGKLLVYIPDVQSPKTGSDLWLLPLEGDRKPVPYLATEFRETNGQFSPDGKWMAYRSNESGQDEVYVQPVPATGAKFQISTSGGGRPRWRRDGRELFYTSADGKLMAIPIKVGASIEAGIPMPLFDFPTSLEVNIHQFYYQPSANGQRFVVNAPTVENSSAPVTVVLNWQAGLKRY